MTLHTSTPASCESVADLVAGAALDALTPDERLALQRHIALCPSCAADVEELRSAASVLALGVPGHTPPPELKQRLMDSALLGPRVTPAPASLDSARRRFPRVSPVWGSLAAALVVAVGSLAWAASLQSQVAGLAAQAQAERDKAARYDRVVQVLASQQLAVRRLASTQQGLDANGTVWLDPASQSGMIMLRDLPTLPPGRAWQLWFVKGTQRVSGGLLWADQNGLCYSLINVPPNVGDYDSLGVTDEPSTGSVAPTTPRVMGASLQ